MTEPEDKKDDVEERSADEVGRGDERSEAVPAEPVDQQERADEEAARAAAAAEEAAEAAEDAPTPVAEAAVEEAEELAETADSAKRSRARRRGRKAEEPKAVPVGLKVSAQAKYVRTSARKARLVCDHIRDKDVTEARAILAFTTRDAAKAWSKLLESAVANAEHNHELVGEDLRIANVHADEGPTLKRYRPRAMGRATRIRKRTSHLSITLTPKES
jgi:ribosomal protein L22